MEAKEVKHYIRGRDLKVIRIKAGITTSVMAEFLGIRSRKTIENWESEASTPSINQFILFCRFSNLHAGKVLEKITTRNASDDPEAQIDISECEI